jgi:hypothetical protein
MLAIREKSHSQHYAKWGKVKVIYLRCGTRQECLLLPILFNAILEDKERIITQENIIKNIKLPRKK